MQLSLVVPCYNEEENVERFYACVKETFAGKVDSYEVVFVNDGSTDRTMANLKKLYAREEGAIQLVSFSRNFGKEAAIYAGMSKAKGDLVCLIDADLQQHPNVVLRMMDELEKDPDLDGVTAYQEQRHENKLMGWVKSLFYKIIDGLSEVKFVNGASDFRLMRRPMVDAVLSMTEYHRFSKGIFSWVGFHVTYIPYEAAQRQFGQTKWGTRKLIKYAMEGIVAFSTVPLKIATVVGITSAIGAIIYLIAVVLQKLIAGIAVPGYATVVVLILLMGGLILFCLGIIGEYLAKIYVQTKNRPVYILKEYWDERQPDTPAADTLPPKGDTSRPE